MKVSEAERQRLISAVSQMGFTYAEAERALERHQWDTNAAVNALLMALPEPMTTVNSTTATTNTTTRVATSHHHPTPTPTSTPKQIVDLTVSNHQNAV